MRNESEEKNIISGAAYSHLQKFIAENLKLSDCELKAYHKSILENKKIRKKVRQKIIRKENTDNHFVEFTNYEKSIYREFYNEQNEIKPLKIIGDLTQREQQVVDLLKQGYSCKECSEKLGVRLSTIKTQVNSIMSKRGVHSISQLIVYEFTGTIKGEQKNNVNAAINLLNNLI